MGSLSRWLEEPEREPRLLSAWPIARSPLWTERVNRTLTATELKAVRDSVNRGSPFGDENWVQAIARNLNLQSTLRPRGRPQKKSPDTFFRPVGRVSRPDRSVNGPGGPFYVCRPHRKHTARKA